MADRNRRLPENVPGRFYVDANCIEFCACCESAPNNFRRNVKEERYYVFKQPENSEEEQLCLDAVEGCAVEAIGNDGLEHDDEPNR